MASGTEDMKPLDRTLSKQMRDAGYLPVLQESASLERRIDAAREDAAPSLGHSRCSVISLLALEAFRILLWMTGQHPTGDLWIIHRVCMLTDLFVLSLTMPIAYLGIEQMVIRSGIMGMAMCWIASMCLVDLAALFFFGLYITPLLRLQVGAPLFWHVLTSLLDVWACMLIVSNVLQAVIGVSTWRIYREMRVQRLYPVNATESLTHADVYQAEVFCEPEDVANCKSGCKNTMQECGCAPLSSQPLMSGQSAQDHQQYRVPYAFPCPGEKVDITGDVRVRIPGNDKAVLSENDIIPFTFPCPAEPKRSGRRELVSDEGPASSGKDIPFTFPCTGEPKRSGRRELVSDEGSESSRKDIPFTFPCPGEPKRSGGRELFSDEGSASSRCPAPPHFNICGTTAKPRTAMGSSCRDGYSEIFGVDQRYTHLDVEQQEAECQVHETDDDEEFSRHVREPSVVLQHLRELDEAAAEQAEEAMALYRMEAALPDEKQEDASSLHVKDGTLFKQDEEKEHGPLRQDVDAAAPTTSE